MKKLNTFILNYLKWGFLGIILIIIFQVNVQSSEASSLLQNVLFSGTAIFAISYFLSTCYFFISLVCSTNFRERILTQVLRIQERDEREQLISYKAARLSLLSSIAFCTGLLFLSCLNVNLSNDPALAKGERGVINFSVETTNFLKDSKPPTSVLEKEKNLKMSSTKKDFVKYSGLPFGDSTTLTLILLWQLLSYQLFKKRMKLQ